MDEPPGPFDDDDHEHEHEHHDHDTGDMLASPTAVAAVKYTPSRLVFSRARRLACAHLGAHGCAPHRPGLPSASQPKRRQRTNSGPSISAAAPGGITGAPGPSTAGSSTSKRPAGTAPLTPSAPQEFFFVEDDELRRPVVVQVIRPFILLPVSPSCSPLSDHCSIGPHWEAVGSCVSQLADGVVRYSRKGATEGMEPLGPIEHVALRLDSVKTSSTGEGRPRLESWARGRCGVTSDLAAAPSDPLAPPWPISPAVVDKNNRKFQLSGPFGWTSLRLEAASVAELRAFQIRFRFYRRTRAGMAQARGAAFAWVPHVPARSRSPDAARPERVNVCDWLRVRRRAWHRASLSPVPIFVDASPPGVHLFGDRGRRLYGRVPHPPASASPALQGDETERAHISTSLDPPSRSHAVRSPYGALSRSQGTVAQAAVDRTCNQLSLISQRHVALANGPPRQP